MSRQSLSLAISVCFFFAAPSVIGEESSLIKKNAPTKVDQHLLNDLSRIRKQMGGSVLNGSALDSDEVSNSFQSDLKKLLEQEPSVPQLPTKHQLSVVEALRKHSSILDRVANEIEPTKQYDHADELRTSADELRKLARQLDTDRQDSPVQVKAH